MQAVKNRAIPQSEGASLVAGIARTFWFFSSLKIALVFLLFQSDPAFGTFVLGIISLAIGLFLVSYMALAKNRVDAQTLELNTTAKLVFGFTIWTAITMVWSQAYSGQTALAYWGLTALDIVIAYMLVRLGPLEKIALASLQGVIFGSVCLGLIGLFLSAGTGDNRLGDGEFLNPNMIGNQLAIACLLGVYMVTRSGSAKLDGPISTLSTLFLFFALLQTLSKTSIISFVAAMVFVMLRGKIRLWWKLLVSAAAVAITYFSLSTIQAYWNFYTYEVQGGMALDTISGRTVLWARTWEMILDNPILGYGLLAFRDVGPQIASVRLVQAHNEVLHVWFSYGILGLALTVALYLTHSVQVWRLQRDPETTERATLAGALLVYCLVRGITEANLVGLVYPLPLLLVLTLWLRNSRPHDANPS